MTFALVATMRNEGPYILEWVAYHRLIGFDDIVVCSNDCVDASPELLDLLAARGLLRHLRCTPAPDEKAQIVAYQHAEALLRATAWPDAVMVLDADEFLNIHVGAGRVSDLLAAAPDATTIHVSWRIFGSSGHVRWSPEPVLRRFTRAAEQAHGVNWPFKTLCRDPDAYLCPLLPHGPGFARPDRAAALRAVDGAGRPLPAHYARAETFLQIEPGQVSWALAQVNHYNTRARDDYLAKHDRGGGQGPERWDRDSNWRIFDRGEAEDRTIQRHLPGLDAAMAALLDDPAIAAAHACCCRLYDAHVAGLRGVAA